MFIISQLLTFKNVSNGCRKRETFLTAKLLCYLSLLCYPSVILQCVITSDYSLRLSIEDNAATHFLSFASLSLKSPLKVFLRVNFGLPCFFLPEGFHL